VTYGPNTKTRRRLGDQVLPERQAFRRERADGQMGDGPRPAARQGRGDLEGRPGYASNGAPDIDVASRDLVTEYTINNRKTLADLERRIDLHLTPWLAAGG
jgi:hypothetical protein